MPEASARQVRHRQMSIVPSARLVNQQIAKSIPATSEPIADTLPAVNERNSPANHANAREFFPVGLALVRTKGTLRRLFSQAEGDPQGCLVRITAREVPLSG